MPAAIFSRAGVVPRVFLDGVETQVLRPLALERYAGGGRLDAMTFEYDFYAAGERLVNLGTPTAWDQEVDVWWEEPAANPNDPPTKRPLFFGKLQAQELMVRSGGRAGDGEERGIVTARLDKYLFGLPVRGAQYKPKNTGGVLTTNDDVIVLNPEGDFGKIEGNMSTSAVGALGTPGYRLFLDPESVRTATAQTYQAQGAAVRWDLQNAVWHFLWRGNPNEDFVLNPTWAEVQAALPSDDTLIRSHPIRSGRYLPDILDDLLAPYACGWRIEYTLDTSVTPNLVAPKIAFFRRWQGTQKTVKLQAPPTPPAEVPVIFSPADSQVAELEISMDVSGLANNVIVHGAPKVREITVELYRAWSESNDAVAKDPLDEQNGTPDHTKARVWRDWVLNEAGDYAGSRTTTAPITDHFDLTGPLGSTTIIKRRRFLPCLTQGPEKSPIGDGGVFVEVWDATVSGWVSVKEFDGGLGSYEVLDKECGIRFHRFPLKLFDFANADRRVRITACVAGDTRVSGVATATIDHSALKELNDFYAVLPGFRDSQLQRTGPYTSRFAALVDAATLTADEASDSSALNTAAASILADTDTAAVRCSFELEGCDREHLYPIGTLITKVEGRELLLNAKGSAAPTPRYPQIVGTRLDYQAQRQTLLLEDVDQQLRKFNLDRLRFAPPDTAWQYAPGGIV